MGGSHLLTASLLNKSSLHSLLSCTQTFFFALGNKKDHLIFHTCKSSDLKSYSHIDDSSQLSKMKGYFTPSLVTIVVAQCLPYGKQRMCTQVQFTLFLLVSCIDL